MEPHRSAPASAPVVPQRARAGRCRRRPQPAAPSGRAAGLCCGRACPGGRGAGRAWGWSVWRRLGWGRQPCGGLRAAGAEPGFFPPNRLPKSMMQSGIAMATAASRAPLPAPRWGSGSLRAVRGGRKKKRIKEQNKTWNQKRWRRSCNGNGGAAGAASALRAPRKWIGASRAPRGAGALPGRCGGRRVGRCDGTGTGCGHVPWALPKTSPRRRRAAALRLDSVPRGAVGGGGCLRRSPRPQTKAALRGRALPPGTAACSARRAPAGCRRRTDVPLRLREAGGAGGAPAAYRAPLWKTQAESSARPPGMVRR